MGNLSVSFEHIMRIVIINSRLIDDWPYLRWRRFIVESWQREWHAHADKGKKKKRWTSFGPLTYYAPAPFGHMIDTYNSNSWHYFIGEKKFSIFLSTSLQFQLNGEYADWVLYSYLIKWCRLAVSNTHICDPVIWKANVWFYNPMDHHHHRKWCTEYISLL